MSDSKPDEIRATCTAVKPEPPVEVWIPTPRPRCGARTDNEAGSVCEPGSDETGEYFCPGAMQDAEGRILQPSPGYLAALDAWIEGAADA